MIIPSQRVSRLSVAAACAAALAGAAVAARYFRLGLTLTHYDARGHLVVSRRIFDSITPGWQQIGAVWLPLPHVLNALPVQIDFFYRTGLSAVAMSVAAFALAVAALVWIVATLTESALVAIAAAFVFALNPNVLYLQSTPMTEPLLIALLLVSVAAVLAWTRAARGHDASPVGDDASRAARFQRVASWCLLLACLTRYEAWPATAVLLAAALWVLWRGGLSFTEAFARTFRVALYPGAAVLAFLVFSRFVVGVWFADDFFVPENLAQGNWYAALKEIVWGVRALSSETLVVTAIAGVAAAAFVGLAMRSRAAFALPLALVATSAVPLVAFFHGHPYRIRYAVPLIAAEAISAGLLAGSWKPARRAAAAVLAVVAVLQLHPFDTAAPMVVEAQWDRPNIVARDDVTRCLTDAYGGETIMASMGSLGHYMQDLSRSGFRLRDFLHEGNGDIWLNALHDPRPYAGWMLIEEKAEGGDMLARIARSQPKFLDGYVRTCEAAGVVLYRRLPVSGEDEHPN